MKEGLPGWKQMHHAYIISGPSLIELVDFFDVNLGFAKKGNPDSLILDIETFGISEARNLFNWAIKKPFGERKIAIISLISITSEAQNSLLKLFEEPAPNTYFFLLVKNTGSFLPTLLSRVRVVDIVSTFIKDTTEEENGLKFLKSNISKRMKMIAPIIKGNSSTDGKESARALIVDIAKFIPIKDSEIILEAERFLGGRAPSIKMILEHLAVTLPVL